MRPALPGGLWGAVGFWLLLGWMLAAPAVAATRVGSVVIRTRRGATIAVLPVRGPTSYRWFTAGRPLRLVLDLDAARIMGAWSPRPAGDIRRVRARRHGVRGLRLSFYLRRALPVHVTVRRKRGRATRLQIVFGTPRHRILAHHTHRVVRRRVARRVHARTPYRRVRDVAVLRAYRHTGPVIVCVDPGHGGSDPGTTGPHGLHEKVVTLEIGRLVARWIDATPGMHAVLTRHGDYYVSLARRVLDAQRHRADLFVSIHVNSFPRNPHVAGGAVYMLSEHGASDAEAAMLARTENAADPTIDGVHFAHGDRRLNYVLTDLLQSQAITAGDHLGADILRHLGHVEPLYEHRVQRANFEVLRDPMIPSVLVETAFLSNPYQDRELHERRFVRRLANAIYEGIREYVRAHFPARSSDHYVRVHRARHRTRKYVVRSGDTLSGIAARSGVTVHRLQAINHLSHADIAVGQVLRLPVSAS